MNLKEAFRYQNKLKSLLNDAQTILRMRDNLVKRTTTLLRSKVDPAIADEEVVTSAPSAYADNVDGVVAFAQFVIGEREKLTKAIRAAKNKAPIDIDGETSLNIDRQNLARTLREMARLRENETTIAGGGNAYRFNADGEQVSYRVDAKMVETLRFDRKNARTGASELTEAADKASAEIDAAVIGTTVEYEPPFDVNDEFTVILDDFLAKRGNE